MSKYKSLEHSIKDLLLEKLHDPQPEEEGVFATSPRKSPKFETEADEQRAKSDTAVRKGREPLVARSEDDRGDSIIRRQDSDSSERPHHHQFVRKIDVGEDTIMTKLPLHLLEVVNKSLDATGEGEITQKDILIRRLEAAEKNGTLNAKDEKLLMKLRGKNKMRNESADSDSFEGRITQAINDHLAIHGRKPSPNILPGKAEEIEARKRAEEAADEIIDETGKRRKRVIKR